MHGPDACIHGWRQYSVVIHREQGLREEILFASCYGDIVAAAAECTIACDPRLVSLIARSFPGAVVHRSHTLCAVRSGLDVQPRSTIVEAGRRIITAPPADGTRSVPANFHMRAGTLPHYFRRSREAFPSRQGYLVADPELVKAFKRQWAEFEGMKVGLAWDGPVSPACAQDVPSWDDWRPLLDAPSVLMAMDVDADRDRLVLADRQFRRRLLLPDTVGPSYRASPTGATVRAGADGAPSLPALELLAARITALDLLIATDGVIAHLAGALGVPVWLLLPHAAEFPWPQTGQTTAWYPSMRLYRVQRPGAWPELFDRIATELTATAQHPSAGLRLRPDNRHELLAPVATGIHANTLWNTRPPAKPNLGGDR
jgi:hypothetical protein